MALKHRLAQLRGSGFSKCRWLHAVQEQAPVWVPPLFKSSHLQSSSTSSLSPPSLPRSFAPLSATLLVPSSSISSSLHPLKTCRSTQWRTRGLIREPRPSSRLPSVPPLRDLACRVRTPRPAPTLTVTTTKTPSSSAQVSHPHLHTLPPRLKSNMFSSHRQCSRLLRPVSRRDEMKIFSGLYLHVVHVMCALSIEWADQAFPPDYLAL